MIKVEKRSLTVVQVLPELNSGGVERGTLEVSAFLAARGHRSLVVSGGGRLVPELEAHGGRHINMPIGKKNLSSLFWIPALIRLFRQEPVDILHLRSRMPAWIAYLAWKSLPEMERPRLVTTFHGFYSINAYSAIMTRGERVIAVSRSIADHIRQQYAVDTQKVCLIYRGVDLEIFNPEKVAKQRMADLYRDWRLGEIDAEMREAPLIMLPGRLSRWKGHEVFLRSMSQIKDLPWRAVCVGDLAENPSLADQLRIQSKKLGLDGRLRFVGHCVDMPAALLMADLVVSPASIEAEAFGRIVVEAAAMGKPVIASAQGGSLETVLPGETGWLVPANDSVALASSLREALGNTECSRRFGERGRQWVEQKFTTEIMCTKTLRLYQDLYASGR